MREREQRLKLGFLLGRERKRETRLTKIENWILERRTENEKRERRAGT